MNFTIPKGMTVAQYDDACSFLLAHRKDEVTEPVIARKYGVSVWAIRRIRERSENLRMEIDGLSQPMPS